MVRRIQNDAANPRRGDQAFRFLRSPLPGTSAEEAPLPDPLEVVRVEARGSQALPNSFGQAGAAVGLSHLFAMGCHFRPSFFAFFPVWPDLI